MVVLMKMMTKLVLTTDADHIITMDILASQIQVIVIMMRMMMMKF